MSSGRGVGQRARAVGARVLVMGVAAAAMTVVAPGAAVAAGSVRTTPVQLRETPLYICDGVASGGGSPDGRWVGYGDCRPGPGAPAFGPIYGSFLINARGGEERTVLRPERPQPSGYARTPELVEGRFCSPL